MLEKEPGINAFAMGLTPADACVVVTRGGLEKLKRDELQGMVAHEISHILNADIRLNLRVIALVGGAVGCALGFFFHGLSATSLVGSGQGGFGKTVILRLIVDANTISWGVLLTLFMGFFGGLLPSLWAMRLRPLESLR